MAEVRIAGLVPNWFAFRVSHPRPFHKADPLPFMVSFIDLDSVLPLRDQALLTEEHVCLIALLWATFWIAMRDPEPDDVRRHITAPLQWGYMVTSTDTLLNPALDYVCELLRKNGGQALQGCWLPADAAEVLDVPAGIESEVWPPLCGCPVHDAGPASVIDLVGASRRLLRRSSGPKTALPPTSGPPTLRRTSGPFWRARPGAHRTDCAPLLVRTSIDVMGLDLPIWMPWRIATDDC
jgi:hypothetical protein